MSKIIKKMNFCMFFIAAVCLSQPTQATTLDCQNLYVGRIWIEKGVGLKAVVYLNNANDASGSYWSYFTNWSPDERKEALTILTTAKASKHRVNVVTENPDSCGLQSGATVTNQIFLTTAP
jgi:hypothetical protein